MKPSALNKKLLTLLCFVLGSPSICMADAESVNNDKLPVLRLTVDGKIKKDMEYTNGTMQLTSEGGGN